MCQSLEGMIPIHFLHDIVIRSQNSHAGILHPINIFRVINHKDKTNSGGGEERRKRNFSKNATGYEEWQPLRQPLLSRRETLLLQEASSSSKVSKGHLRSNGRRTRALCTCPAAISKGKPTPPVQQQARKGPLHWPSNSVHIKKRILY